MAKRILFAAPASDSGKTVITCAFLQAMLDKKLSPAAFKCGPDFIDPMFHTRILGVPSRNLDLFFSSPDNVRETISRYSCDRDIAVIEGVMGFYDGIADTTDASSYHLGRESGTPAILVVSPKGASLSLAASLQGILGFRRDHTIQALLLNRCSEHYFKRLAPMLEQECGLPVAGWLPEMPEASLERRHLGLLLPREIPELRRKIATAAELMAKTVNLDLILEIAASAAALPAVKPLPLPPGKGPAIAVAQDEAFCFYYRENLELLESFGARILPFSPLRDAALPSDAAALYLGGGYPELHAAALSANETMRASIRDAVAAGLPTLAECGGFQYLQDFLVGLEGRSHPMTGVLRGSSAPSAHGRFGYVTLTARRDTMLCVAGETIPAHEFHRWDSAVTGDAFTAQKPRSETSWPCIIAQGNLFAGYPHLYLPGSPGFAERFVKAANAYQKEKSPWQNQS